MSEAQARLLNAPELMKKLTSVNGLPDSELVRTGPEGAVIVGVGPLSTF